MFKLNYEKIAYIENGLTLEEANAMEVIDGHDYFCECHQYDNGEWVFRVIDIDDMQEDEMIEKTKDFTEIIAFAQRLLEGFTEDDFSKEELEGLDYRWNILQEAKERIIKRKEKKNVITR